MLHREVSLHPCCSGVRGKIAGFEISDSGSSHTGIRYTPRHTDKDIFRVHLSRMLVYLGRKSKRN